MAGKTYLVRIRPPLSTIQAVVAARAEIHGEHLAFVDSNGGLTALFLLELIQSWNEADGLFTG